MANHTIVFPDTIKVGLLRSEPQDITINGKEVRLDNNEIRRLLAIATRTNRQPVSVVKTFTIGGGATGGTWTITVDGQTATGLAKGISLAALKTALEALSTVTALNGVTVTGTVGTSYRVNFGASVTTVTASAAGLTPTGTVTIS